MQTESFSEANKMNLRNWSRRCKNNHFVIFEDSLDALLTLDDLVVNRVLQHIEGDFGLLNLRKHLSIFWLGAPLSHCENRTGFAELCKD